MPKTQNYGEQTTADQNNTELLEPQEVLVCEQLAAGVPPWSQRAQALLALHHGSSTEAASEASGLRTTQVNFWLNKFHKDRMGIFPEQFLIAEDNSAAEIATPPGEDLPVLAEPAKTKQKKKKTQKKKEKPGKNKKKKTKAKKGKNKKKSGKAKK